MAFTAADVKDLRERTGAKLAGIQRQQNLEPRIRTDRTEKLCQRSNFFLCGHGAFNLFGRRAVTDGELFHTFPPAGNHPDQYFIHPIALQAVCQAMRLMYVRYKLRQSR